MDFVRIPASADPLGLPLHLTSERTVTVAGRTVFEPV